MVIPVSEHLLTMGPEIAAAPFIHNALPVSRIHHQHDPK